MVSETELPSIYKPLADTNEIRLLFLQPRSSTDGIICQMKHFKLSDNRQYEALSYVWGSQKDKGAAFINLQKFPIGRNLESALLHLKLDDKIRVLWIDAISINQSDVLERDLQVTQMGQIYSRARRVVAWLGPSNNISRQAIRAIPEINSDTSELYYLWHNEEKESYDNEILEPIKVFCCQKYWSRLWIIQEVILAADILIQCGTDHLRWSQLCVFFAELDFFDRSTRKLPLRADSRGTVPAQLVREWKDRKMKEMIKDYQFDTTLFALYYRYQKAECQDPRDKVYGLQSLAAKCCNDAVPINYSLPLYDLCGVLLQHHVLAHMDEEAIGSSKRALEDSDKVPRREKYSHTRGGQIEYEFEERRTSASTSIMHMSQLLHRSMHITSRERPKLVSIDAEQKSNNQKEVESPDPGADVIARSPATFLSHPTEEFIADTTGKFPIRESGEKTPKESQTSAGGDARETSKKHRLKRWHSKLLNLPSKVHGRYSTRTAPTSTPADPPDTPADMEPLWPEEILLPAPGTSFKVIGDYKGRIKYLLPVEMDDIAQNIKCTEIPQNLVYLEDIQVNRETDLVCRIDGGQHRVSIPLNFSIAGTLNIAKRSFDCSEVIWERAKKVLSKIISKDYMIAVGDHDLMYFVPLGTKVGDLICRFPKTNIVAIVRGESGSNARIIGRAVSVDGSLFADSSVSDRSASSVRGSERSRANWAPDEAATEQVGFSGMKTPILFELDVPTLQLLTHASALSVSEFDGTQMKPKSYQVLRSQPLRWPGTQYLTRHKQSHSENHDQD